MERSDGMIVAVDLGAGSGRVVSGCIRHGRLELTEVRRFVHPPREAAGLLRWDPEFLKGEILQGIAEAGYGSHVLSVGIDTWGVDFVLLDDQGTPLEAPRCYRNEHTRAFVAPVLAALGEGRVYQATGIQTQHFNTLFQLAAWKAQSPESWSRARRFAMMPDWLLHRLGAPLVNELSNASTTQLLNARTRDWDQGLLDDLEIPSTWFSKPVEPGSLLGGCVALGRHRPALIAPATHDTGSAVAAIPLTNERSAFIATGTWCLIGMESTEPETGDAARAANFTNEAGVDGTYRFLKNCMGLWLLQQLKSSWPGCPDFGELAARAAEQTPWGALVDVDDPAFFQPASMREALSQWLTESGQGVPDTPAAFARVCVDSLVLAFVRSLREIETIRGLRLETIHLVGGGSRNALLCQLTADATGLPVWAGPTESSALGNLIVQGRTLGLVADLQEARQLVARSFPLVEYRPRGTQDQWRAAAQRLSHLREQKCSKGDHAACLP